MSDWWDEETPPPPVEVEPIRPIKVKIDPREQYQQAVIQDLDRILAEIEERALPLLNNPDKRAMCRHWLSLNRAT